MLVRVFRKWCLLQQSLTMDDRLATHPSAGHAARRCVGTRRWGVVSCSVL